MDLVYTLPGSSLQTVVSNIGQVYSGYWNGSLNLNEYGIVSGSQVYVRMGVTNQTPLPLAATPAAVPTLRQAQGLTVIVVVLMDLA